jgi:hypothetical protein
VRKIQGLSRFGPVSSIRSLIALPPPFCNAAW